MPGEYLPPVVTTLTGDIDQLLAKLAEAKAAIKGLNTTVAVKFSVDTASLTRALASAKTAIGKGLTIPINFEFNGGQLASGMASAQAVASRGIKVPVSFDYSRFTSWGGTGAMGGSSTYWAGQQFLDRNGLGPSAWQRATSPDGNGGYYPAGGGGGGFWGGLAAGTAGSAFAGGGGGRQNGGWGAWWGGGLWNSFMGRNGVGPYMGTHLGLLGLAGAGMGVAGGLFNAGSLAAVTGTGASAFYQRSNLLAQSVLATIPPGAPDYPLLKTFGYAGNPAASPIARATPFGTGMVSSGAGGVVALMNRQGPLSQLVAQHGLSTASTIDNIVARMDLAAQHPQTLQRAIGNITSDATNLGSALYNTGAFFGHAVSHMPGEIEWLTTALRNGTQWANDIWSTPGLKTVASDAVFSGLLLHASSLGLRGTGGLLNLAGKLPFIPSGLGGLSKSAAAAGKAAASARVLAAGGTAAEAAAAAAAAPEAGGLAAAGMFSLPALGLAATIGTGLAAYRYQSPTSAAIGALMSGIGLGKTGPINSGSFSQNIGPALYNLIGGAKNGSTAESLFGSFLNGTGGTGRGPTRSGLGSFSAFDMAAAPLTGGLSLLGGTSVGRDIGNFLTFGLMNKELSPAQQNYKAAMAAANQYLAYGSAENAIMGSIPGMSLANASYIMSMDGTKMGKNGPVGGNAMVTRLAQNYLNGQRINTGGTQQALMNIGVGRTVQDSAWTNATQINSNWDTYMGAMTGGGGSLGGVLNALQGTAPLLPGSAFLTKATTANPNGTLTSFGANTMSFVNTMQAIQGSGNPMADFFRQAQSVNAIGGKSMTNSMADLAASLLPVTGNSKQAQAALVALANEGGGHFKNMAQVVQAAGGSASTALVNLTNSTATVTQKMAQAGPFASAVMQKMSSDTTTALAAIIQKSPTATNAFKSLVGQIAQGSPASRTAKTDIATLTSYLEGKHMSYQQIADVFKQMGVNITDIPSNKTVTITVNGVITASAQKALSIAAAGSFSFGVSSAALHPPAVNPMIPLPTYSGGVKRTGGQAGGTPSAPPGWAWVGEQGPELMHFTGGESVIPHHVATGYAHGAGMAGMAPCIHSHIYLDGRELQATVKQRTYQYNVDNGNRDKQGRVAGTMRPR